MGRAEEKWGEDSRWKEEKKEEERGRKTGRRPCLSSSVSLNQLLGIDYPILVIIVTHGGKGELRDDSVET